mgnify:CR=1 FL=1
MRDIRAPFHEPRLDLAVVGLLHLAQGEVDDEAALAETVEPEALAATEDVRRVDRDLDELVPEFRRRLERVISRMESEFGHDVTIVEIDAFTTERSGYDAVNALIERGDSFDALFCASDLIAIGAMRALQEKGFAIPLDVAIAGFDDIPVASFTNPSLTTVQQDTKPAANLLVETLLALIQGETVQSTTISAPVVIRQSTRR